MFLYPATVSTLASTFHLLLSAIELVFLKALEGIKELNSFSLESLGSYTFGKFLWENGMSFQKLTKK